MSLPELLTPTLCPECLKDRGQHRFLDNHGRCGACSYGWEYSMESFKPKEEKLDDTSSGRLVGPDRGTTAPPSSPESPYNKLTMIEQHITKAWELLKDEPEDGFRHLGSSVYAALTDAVTEKNAFKKALDYQRRKLL